MTSLAPGLSDRRTMLLLFALAVDGEKAVPLFGLLPPREAKQLEAEGARLLALPKEARIPFLMREMKRVRDRAGGSPLDAVHPEWLIGDLSRERPQTVRIVLDGLDEPTVGRILERLSAAEVRRLPDSTVTDRVAPAVRDLVRRRFASRFVRPSDLPSSTKFDLLGQLSSRELYEITRGLGFDKMALAYRGLAEAELTRAIKAMNRPDKQDLVARMRQLEEVDARKVKRALKALAAFFQGEIHCGDPILEVGLDRLARAASPQDPRWIRLVAQKLDRRVGTALLRRHIAATDVELREAGRIQRTAVDEAKRLGRVGRLDPAWAKVF